MYRKSEQEGCVKVEQASRAASVSVSAFAVTGFLYSGFPVFLYMDLDMEPMKLLGMLGIRISKGENELELLIASLFLCLTAIVICHFLLGGSSRSLMPFFICSA